MTLAEIESYLDTVEKNPSIFEEHQFENRNEVIDFIDFHLLDYLNEQMIQARRVGNPELLKCRADELKLQLEAIDTGLFKNIQSGIRRGSLIGASFKDAVAYYIDLNDAETHWQEPEYDVLDLFINGLLPDHTMPEPSQPLESGMVHYQKTPARIVFDIVEQLRFKKEDVSFDLGSGLGQTSILFHLLTGMRVKGIEFEPAFCDHAARCVQDLNLPGISFVNADARVADYAEGSIFFLFTPFSGAMLDEVLDRLHQETLKRKITVISYGPCSARISGVGWLRTDDATTGNIYTPLIFYSFMT